MLGADAAAALLADANPPVDVWSTKPNRREYFTAEIVPPLVFIVRKGGADAKPHHVRQRSTEKPWRLKATAFAPFSEGLRHARITCSQASTDGFVLTGDRKSCAGRLSFADMLLAGKAYEGTCTGGEDKSCVYFLTIRQRNAPKVVLTGRVLLCSVTTLWCWQGERCCALCSVTSWYWQGEHCCAL